MLLILPLLCVWSSSAKCTVPQHPLLAPLVFIASCWAPKCALFKEGWGVGGCWARAGPHGFSVMEPVVPPIPACPGCFSPLLGKSLEVLAGACSRGACVLQHSRDLTESTKDDSQRLRSRICSPGMLPPSDVQLQSLIVHLNCRLASVQAANPHKHELAGRSLQRDEASGLSVPALPAQSPKASLLPGRVLARPPARGWGRYQRAHD